MKAYLAIGSNLGDRQAQIAEAVRLVGQMPRTRVTAVSTIIESAPEGNRPDDPPYLNGALGIETELLPYELLSHLQRIEYALGRIRRKAQAPRTIDLDILLYGDLVMDEVSLTIPHPRMHQRPFVMGPLLEIAPRIRVPNAKHSDPGDTGHHIRPGMQHDAASRQG
jgi:2-amino-4-hydroxy-6-hydroxymethyldihydropteridine diphosphokinase